MQGTERVEGRPRRGSLSKCTVAQWDRHSSSQVWGSTKRKGLEVRARRDLGETGQGAAWTKATKFRRDSGSPRHLTLWSKTRNGSHTAGSEGPISSCRPLPIEWLVAAAWLLSPPYLIPVENGPDQASYWYIEESTIPTLMICYIKYCKSYLEYLRQFQREVLTKS